MVTADLNRSVDKIKNTGKATQPPTFPLRNSGNHNEKEQERRSTREVVDETMVRRKILVALPLPESTS